MPVDVVTVQQSDIPISNEWVGTLDGFVNANIQPQVSGYLIKQNYREGSVVQKGQVLFEIDPRPFQATLEQAQGQLGQAQGAVGQAQAQRRIDHAPFQGLHFRQLRRRACPFVHNPAEHLP